MQSIKVDSDRVHRLEQQIRDLQKTQDQFAYVDASYKNLAAKVDEAQLTQQYIEKVLPL